MNIRTDKRTGIKYIDYRIKGKRKRISLETKSNEVAYEKAKWIIDNKKVIKNGKEDLGSFLDKYRAYLKTTRKPDTAYHFELGLKKLLNYQKIKYLAEITPALLDSLAIHLKAHSTSSSPAGINRAIRAIKTAMRQAEFWDLIPPQNWRKVSEFKEKRGRLEFHTPNEITYLIEHLPSEWELVILLGAQAGLRRGEMAILKWRDVDFINNQLYIAPNKTEKHRYIPLTENLRKALRAAQKTANSDYVIAVGDVTKRFSHGYLTAYYRKLTASFPFYCHLHKLRHTFASHLVQAGIDLYRVSKLLGHSSIQMTEIYAHLAPADLANAVNKLPQFTK